MGAGRELSRRCAHLRRPRRWLTSVLGDRLMGTVQFGRKVSLIVGKDDGDAIDLSDLRITFKTERTDEQTLNKADIRIYNVSETTTQRIGSEFKRLVLQAGYEGN